MDLLDDFVILASNGGTNSTGPNQNSHEQPGAEVMFLSVSLVIGAVLRHVVTYFRLSLPYTVLLLITGIVMAFVNEIGDLRERPFGSAMSKFVAIDPHLLLIVFLPALIFESAFSTNFHIIWREMGQALLLAGPAVICSTVLLACVANFVFDYSWGWPISLMFGAILSATDPVAVVALLREIGASKRLATLIEAESLLNDGTAFVAFLIAKEFIQCATCEPSPSVGEVITTFLQLALGGIALGLAVGIPTVLWLSRVFNDVAVETTITLSAAYFTFWAAEADGMGLHVSGVLAVVTLGLYMSKNKTSISPQIEHHLHTVWEFVSYVANTVIFILSGVIVGDKLILSWKGTEEDSSVRWTDVGYLILLYVVMHIVRAFAIVLLWPALSRIGYGITWQQATVLTYGGLRGAVSLALALIVFTDPDETIFDTSVRSRIVFHVAGIVFLTLLVNGSTTGRLLRVLGMTSGTPAGNLIFSQALHHMQVETRDLVEKLRHTEHYREANWEEIGEFIPDFEKVRPKDVGVLLDAERQDNLHSVRLSSDSRRPSEVAIDEDIHGAKVMSPLKHLDESTVRAEVSRRLVQAMKASYWKQFEEGELTRQAVGVLVECADSALDDKEGNQLRIQWQEISTYFSIPPLVNRIHHYLPVLGNVYLYHRLSFATELATGFLEAAEQLENIQKEFPEFTEFSVVENLRAETDEYREQAHETWMSILKSFPEIYTSIQTKHAALHILSHSHHQVSQFFEFGLLEDREYQEMNDLVWERVYALERLRPPPSRVAFSNSILIELDFYSELTPSMQHDVLSSHLALFNPEQVLVENGEQSAGVYVITRGIVEAEGGRYSNNRVETRGVGALVGLWGYMTGRPLVGAVKAKTYVEAVFLNSRLMENIMTNKRANEKLWKIAAIIVVKAMFMTSFGQSKINVNRMCEHAEFVLCGRDGMTMRLHTSILLLTGQAMLLKTKRKVYAPYLIEYKEGAVIKIAGLSRMLMFRGLRRKTERRASKHQVVRREIETPNLSEVEMTAKSGGKEMTRGNSERGVKPKASVSEEMRETKFERHKKDRQQRHAYRGHISRHLSTAAMSPELVAKYVRKSPDSKSMEKSTSQEALLAKSDNS